MNSNFFLNLRATLNATISSRRPTIVLKKTGSIWMHLWIGGAIFDSRRLSNPAQEGLVNYPLFTHHYKPRKGDTVLDLGAGIGTELLQFSKNVGSRGQVVAVDASPQCAEMMKLLVAQKKLHNVEICEYAVGGYVGRTFFSSSGTELTGRISSSNLGIPVEMVTINWLLDRFNIDVVDLLKLNIEGSELDALRALDVSRVRRIVVSCHDFMGKKELETFDGVFSWAKENGFVAEQLQDAIPGSCESFYLFLTSSSLV